MSKDGTRHRSRPDRPRGSAPYSCLVFVVTRLGTKRRHPTIESLASRRTVPHPSVLGRHQWCPPPRGVPQDTYPCLWAYVCTPADTHSVPQPGLDLPGSLPPTRATVVSEVPGLSNAPFTLSVLHLPLHPSTSDTTTAPSVVLPGTSTDTSCPPPGGVPRAGPLGQGKTTPNPPCPRHGCRDLTGTDGSTGRFLPRWRKPRRGGRLPLSLGQRKGSRASSETYAPAALGDPILPEALPGPPCRGSVNGEVTPVGLAVVAGLGPVVGTLRRRRRLTLRPSVLLGVGGRRGQGWAGRSPSGTAVGGQRVPVVEEVGVERRVGGVRVHAVEVVVPVEGLPVVAQAE